MKALWFDLDSKSAQKLKDGIKSTEKLDFIGLFTKWLDLVTFRINFGMSVLVSKVPYSHRLIIRTRGHDIWVCI